MDGRVKINLLDLKLPNLTRGDFTPRWRCFNNHVYYYFSDRISEGLSPIAHNLGSGIVTYASYKS